MQNGKWRRPSHCAPDSELMMFYFSAVFTWTNLLVVVAELDGNENEALDLVPLVTNVVLEVSQAVKIEIF